MTFGVNDVVVLRDGQPRYILAAAADTTVLVRMRLLERHNLSIGVEDGGRVLIRAEN